MKQAKRTLTLFATKDTDLGGCYPPRPTASP